MLVLLVTFYLISINSKTKKKKKYCPPHASGIFNFQTKYIRNIAIINLVRVIFLSPF